MNTKLLKKKKKKRDRMTKKQTLDVMKNQYAIIRSGSLNIYIKNIIMAVSN